MISWFGVFGSLPYSPQRHEGHEGHEGKNNRFVVGVRVGFVFLRALRTFVVKGPRRGDE
jgi:hypothetical protein